MMSGDQDEENLFLGPSAPTLVTRQERMAVNYASEMLGLHRQQVLINLHRNNLVCNKNKDK